MSCEKAGPCDKIFNGTTMKPSSELSDICRGCPSSSSYTLPISESTSNSGSIGSEGELVAVVMEGGLGGALVTPKAELFPETSLEERYKEEGIYKDGGGNYVLEKCVFCGRENVTPSAISRGRETEDGGREYTPQCQVCSEGIRGSVKP